MAERPLTTGPDIERTMWPARRRAKHDQEAFNLRRDANIWQATDRLVAEWLACWTQAQKGPGSNRSRDAVR